MHQLKLPHILLKGKQREGGWRTKNDTIESLPTKTILTLTTDTDIDHSSTKQNPTTQGAIIQLQ